MTNLRHNPHYCTVFPFENEHLFLYFSTYSPYRMSKTADESFLITGS